MSTGRRVVMTGLGAVTPSGLDADALWASVREGRSAIEALEGDEFSSLPVRIGGRVRDFDAEGLVPRSLARRLSPVHLWAIAAADEAVQQATADGGASAGLPWSADRVDVIAASGSGPVDPQQHATRAFDTRGPRAVPLGLAVHGAPDAAAALLTQRYGIFGAAHAVSATCASGAAGLGDAMRRIRHGYADAVIVVGMEDCLNPVNLASNANLRALASGYEADPRAACRPFDRARSGFVMSQGAAAIVLESEAGARDRGAEVLAELSGFGASSDAHHPTSPHPQGAGAARAIHACLLDAEHEMPAGRASNGQDEAHGASGVDHINAHGTGTPAGDAAELAAFASVFGAGAERIPISATKSSTGHLLGAAGIAEAIIAVMTLRDGALPPTLNLEHPEAPGWDFVTGSARPYDARSVLSTSFGFGGHNAALLIRRAEESEKRG